MKVTNEMGLPEPFVRAVQTERHNQPGCYSATTLLKGIKEIQLTDRHYDELTIDASDSVFQIWGTAVHSIFENIDGDNCFKEEKFSTEIDGITITGTADCVDLEKSLLIDWKTCSSWKIINKDFDDWKRQGQIYAYLMRKAGLEVKRVQFIALIKDHSKTKAKTDKDYPKSPVYVFSFDITSKDLFETELYIRTRIRGIKNSMNLGDDEIEACTPDERWEDPPKFACMKTGRKSAVKLFDSKEDCEKFVKEKGSGYYLEERPSMSRKCSEYCICKEFCNFYKENVCKIEQITEEVKAA